MSARRVRLILAVIFALGLVARILAARFAPIIHPDTCFQYLEPAWHRLTGAGVKAWEWNDGLRSWVLPGFHGAWLALGLRLGLRGSTMAELIRLGWAFVSLFLVWAAFRAGASCARQLRPKVPCGTCGHLHFENPASVTFVGDTPPDGWQGGLAAAALMALFPLLSIYSVEPLSELPSMILMVVGIALTAEYCESDSRATPTRAALIGFLLSLAVCLRVVNAVLVILPVFWIASRKRWLHLAAMAAAAAVPVFFFGLVDWLTWGDWFHSYIAHIRFNVVEGGAANFGKMPPHWYFTALYSRLPWGLLLLVPSALWGLRATWPYLLSAATFLACISTQVHKEERFAVPFWPLLIIAAGSVLGRWLFPDQARPLHSMKWKRALVRSRQIACALALLAVIVDSGSKLHGIDYGLPHARFDAQAWVGRQPTASGLLIDWHFDGGGYLWLGKGIPQVHYDRKLLANQLFSHVLVRKESTAAKEAVDAGFVPKFDRDGILVLERTQ